MICGNRFPCYAGLGLEETTKRRRTQRWSLKAERWSAGYSEGGVPEVVMKLCWSRLVMRIIVSVFAAVLSVAFAFPAGAHSWTHYRRIWNASNDRYGGYAWLGADETVDYIHARLRILASDGRVVRDDGIICGPASEGCGFRRTTSTYWERRTRWVEHFHCGYDKTPAGYVHKFKGRPGDTSPYGPCSTNSLYTHVHDYYYP